MGIEGFGARVQLQKERKVTEHEVKFYTSMTS
jgi:hypothetical protein